jgi:acetyl esterase/lipase
MNENSISKYKREMQGYADLYKMIFRSSSPASFKRDNQILDQVLKGKWPSFDTEAKTFYLPREDGSELRVLKVTKKDHQDHSCAGLLWLHGGGYAIGLPEMDAMFANRFCADDDCVMFLPDYRRSLDAPYPAALQDAYQTLLYMKENAAELGIREDQLFVGGESAGGGLACALCQYARDMQEVNIAFQMPLYPMIDDRMTATSAHSFAPLWDTKKNLLSWKLYRGENQENSPYYAPARQKNYEDLPPAFSIIGDQDPFYAETKDYFKHLYEAGSQIMLKEYPGCFHAFDITCPNTKSAKHACRLEQNALKYAIHNYFASQPVNAPDAEEADIDDMIDDIETQQDLLDAYRNEPEEVQKEDLPEEDTDEKVPDLTSAIPEEDAQDAAEEPVPENSEETVPEEDPFAEEQETAAEEPAVIKEEVLETMDVEERPVSESTAVPFPDHPEAVKEVITEEEIDTISNKLTQILPETDAEIAEEELAEAEQTSDPAEEEPEIKSEEAEEKPKDKESFTKDDIMELLEKKKEHRHEDVPPKQEDEPKDLMTNLQKIIESDTNDSLDKISNLVDKL